ncbi:DUF551 domain-containing protein [Escherichia coli]|jgi:hypothetical protein|uniref:DUF551 domain-containing protein n=1 Tax=Escherichia coli TaxID=562 RepID=UPI000CDBD3B8|nr:DUF551 domain-containing protein [Escherichia coli]HDQ6501042.1 DUF551 domain-containing protein [Escherichia coli Ou:H6]AUZ89909.1 hypothetical protein BXO92_02135 [Escherichia coli]EGH7044531.1 DUF551 domain-containing protein [Escherichia coli]EGM7807687.1 DUF551 domain-containing protein [Escherichia coli]EHW2736970.1 DUF551 domain-containing protein [Escherichia coli]
MNTLTKEWLQNTITSIESARDEIPFGLDEDQNNMLTALKIALASLGAEPVAYIFKHPAGKLFWALTDESNKEQADVIPVYAAPSVPVVPEEKPMPNPLKMYAVDAVAAIAEVRGWNACRAAMLHGAEPVSQTYKSQHTQFEQVADLYEMQFDDGRTCAFHTDAQKAAQWLQACDGNRVQEYVKLERLRNALSGNYPVTPDGWISCSERMPEKNQNVLISVNFDSSLVEPLICSARYTGSTFRRGDATIKPGNGIEQATHWMPLPEPPQEAK